MTIAAAALAALVVSAALAAALAPTGAPPDEPAPATKAGPTRVAPGGSVPQARAADRFVYRQVHMGMQVRLVLYAESEAEARRVATAAFAEIARLDAMLSNYRPNSEINALAEAPAEPRAASPELVAVLARAQELAELTGGAFDVTAGPLTELWRRAIERQALPAPAAIEAARLRSGYRRLRVDEAAGVVTIEPGTSLDVGGIAKGFVLDRALEVIAGRGIDEALVEAGGDLVAGAAPPGSDGWRIDVPHLGCHVVLRHAALATSGDDFQFVAIEGVRYSHTVDPRTGLGLKDSRTVSVIATDGVAADGVTADGSSADGATADGLATALTLLSLEEGAELLAAFPSVRLLHAPSPRQPAARNGEAACLSRPRPARSR